MSFNLNVTNKLQLLYFDAKNCDSTNIYVPQQIEDCTTLGTRYGSSICGVKKKNCNDEVYFYVFGGTLVDNSSFDETFMNDIHIIDVTMYGGVPNLISVNLITVIGSDIPVGRAFSHIKLSGSYLYITSGMDKNNKIINDYQRFSILDNVQIEIIPDGYINNKILCGN